MRKIIIALDFDGTLVNFSYPTFGEIIPEAFQFINDLKDKCDFILWTCRTDEDLEKIKSYFKSIGIEFAAINENVKYLPFKTSNKIFADFYIDDRAGFDGNWEKMKAKIFNYAPDDFIIKSE